MVIRIKVLLTTIDLPIDPDSAEKVMYDESVDETNIDIKKDDNKNNYVILPINYLRVFYFLVTNTPIKGIVTTSSGLWEIIQNKENYVTISLLWEGDEQVITTSRVPLHQFRSDYVNIIDSYIPLPIGLSSTEIHVYY